MSRLPKNVTSHSGTDCKKPTPSMASMISCGSVTLAALMPPILLMMVCTTPPQTANTEVISSMALPTAILASRKRMKCRRANSGRCKSRKLAAERNTLMAKNSTSRP